MLAIAFSEEMNLAVTGLIAFCTTYSRTCRHVNLSVRNDRGWMLVRHVQ